MSTKLRKQLIQHAKKNYVNVEEKWEKIDIEIDRYLKKYKKFKMIKNAMRLLKKAKPQEN